jgi:hypothetical protein
MTHKNSQESETEQNSVNYSKLAGIAVLGLVFLVVAIFFIVKFTQKDSPKNSASSEGNKNQQTSNKTGEKTGTKQAIAAPPPKFTLAGDVTWNAKAGTYYPYAFSYPSNLPLVVFINDQTDSVAIVWGNIPAQQNVLFNVEIIANRDAKYVNQPKVEYVKNWYKFFSGLKGVSKMETFANVKGLKGYKVWYLNTANTAPNVDVFFEIPKRNDIMLHFANGIIDEPIFDKIIDSARWEEKISPTIAVSPTPTKSK